MRGYSRHDVQMHSDTFGPSRPAVNVKVYRGPSDVFAKLPDADLDDPRFTLEWIETHLSDEYLDGLFWFTCANEFEMIEQDAAEIFGAHVSVYSEGRSGGWAVVDGLPDLEDWDAVQLAKWRKFEKYARSIADDVPYQMVASIFSNEYATWLDEQDDAAPYNAELPVDQHR